MNKVGICKAKIGFIKKMPLTKGHIENYTIIMLDIYRIWFDSRPS